MGVRRSAKIAVLLVGAAAVTTVTVPTASAATPTRWSVCSDPTPLPAPAGAGGTGTACMVYSRNGELGGWTSEQFNSADPGKWQRCVMGGLLMEIDSAGHQVQVASFPPNGVDCLAAAQTNTSAGAVLSPSFRPQRDSGYFVVLFVLSKYNDNVVFGFDAGHTATVHFS
jgi:hypothetical protein